MLTKTCVVAASCREMAGIHANVPRAPLCCSFALMARSAASFLLLIFPWIDWLHIKVIKFVVAPRGSGRRFPFSLSIAEAWDVVCVPSKGCAMMFPLLPYSFSIPFSCFSPPSLLLLTSSWCCYECCGESAVHCCAAASSSQILWPLSWKAKNPRVSRWGGVRKKQRGKMGGRLEMMELMKRKKQDFCFICRSERLKNIVNI